jgi:anthranilate/para-aminobenzoate synthase component I
MMIADSLVILDNLFGRAIVVVNVEVPRDGAPAALARLYDAAEQRLDELIGRLGDTHHLAPLALQDGVAPIPTESRYPREAFERDVARILEYIKAGDTFQTVLSRRQEAPGATTRCAYLPPGAQRLPTSIWRWTTLRSWALPVLVRVETVRLPCDRPGPAPG